MDSETARELRKQRARLSRTAAGANKSMPSGTSFPTGIAAGFLFFRTDFNFLCVYDGGNWITVHEYSVVITYSTDLTATYAATTNAVRRGMAKNSQQPFLTRGEIFTGLAAGTSNATNFWTVAVVAVDNATTVWSFDTKTDSAAANTLHTTTSLTQVAAAESTFRIDITKTLAPPNISFLGAVLFYRLILT